MSKPAVNEKQTQKRPSPFIYLALQSELAVCLAVFVTQHQTETEVIQNDFGIVVAVANRC